MWVTPSELREAIRYKISKLPEIKESQHHEKFDAVRKKVETDFLALTRYFLVCITVLRNQSSGYAKDVITLFQPLQDLEFLYYNYLNTKSIAVREEMKKKIRPYIPEMRLLIEKMKAAFGGQPSMIEDMFGEP